jgi:hypothetical protein
MIDPYIDSFDEESLPVDIADEVFARVLNNTTTDWRLPTSEMGRKRTSGRE